ncbi:unnamed protein product [Gongylonema pulchrum]|uniref:Peroxisomal membrane protein PEX16 n=1 Tax=Gongylonema pulchrum TaxID=637853 RepID=A0A183E328_9BILA|nr:unnamed protein product [Gongylonema pulchrum]
MIQLNQEHLEQRILHQNMERPRAYKPQLNPGLRIFVLQSMMEILLKHLLLLSSVQLNTSNGKASSVVCIQLLSLALFFDFLIVHSFVFGRSWQSLSNKERWANLRRRKLHAVQLGWMVKYLSEKWKMQSNQLASSDSEKCYSVLATRGVQYLVNDLLNNARDEGRLMNRLRGLSVREREVAMARFITLYLKRAYAGIVTQSLRGNDALRTGDAQRPVGNRSLVVRQGATERSHRKRSVETQTTATTLLLRKRGRRSDDIQRFANSSLLWRLFISLSPGIKISLRGWYVPLTYNPTIVPIFRLVCNICNLLLTTSPVSPSHFRLCPNCFKSKAFFEKSNKKSRKNMPFTSSVRVVIVYDLES